MITIRLFRANHPSRVTFRRSSSGGQWWELLANLVVMTDNLAIIANSEIGRVSVTGTLPMADVDNALHRTAGL